MMALMPGGGEWHPEGDYGEDNSWRSQTAHAPGPHDPARKLVLEMCSVHNKKRTAQNLEDDGDGGLRCIPKNPCTNTEGSFYGGGGGQWSGGIDTLGGGAPQATHWTCLSC